MLPCYFQAARLSSCRLLTGLLLVVVSASSLRAADVKLTPDELDFFEKKVRPVLVENCYRCHSHASEKIKGGLLLDTRDGVLKGGDNGVVIVPGHPEKSVLITAIRYTDKDLQMPPNDKQLPANLIADLDTWVKMGAPDPRTGTNDDAHPYKMDLAKAREHWSFRPIAHPEVPRADVSSQWVKTPIDQFIFAALLTNHLAPAPLADKATLLRRATYDLIGLPPTMQEMEDFVADDSPDAFARVVDRLLASPHYGERWGRYWLDLAHFADTRGLGNRDDIYPYAYTYRDYVIRAFNDDLPYDQFIIQQIAADKLPQTDDKSTLAALGFLTLGNRYNNQVNDIIDDRIDIVGKSTMSLTMACARCHDHKFDPISTQDYYALHGVFNSCTEPKEGPLLEAPKDTPAYNAFHREYAGAETAIKEFHDENFRKFKAELITKSGAYLLAVHDFRQKSNEVSRNVVLEKRGLNGQIGSIWDNNLRNMEKRHNPIMAPWIAFAELSDDDFAAKAADLAAKFHANTEKDKPINAVIARKFDTAPTSLAQVAARYTSVFEDIEQHWHDALSEADAARKLGSNNVPDPKGLPDVAEEQVRQFMYNNNSPMFMDDNRLNNNFIGRDNNLRNKRDDLDKVLSDLLVNHPGSPARAPVLADMDKPRDSVVFIKGNPGNRGPVVPRHFLTIIAGDPAPKFKEGSGRLELARDIASKDNPLTARVIINRVWLHHFGEGLVRTPDDFGERGDTPSHPELLDYLASRFMDEGWSLKKLHRLIMLSAVYQQTCDASPIADLNDPENRWLSHMNRRRLDFESLRDSILAIGGDLDSTVGGKSIRMDTEPYSMRRAMYGFVDRRNVPNVNQAFDFASPDLTTGRRQVTVVPQQALYMMNNPLVVEQARNIVRRMKLRAGAKPEDGAEALYRFVYQRAPTIVEMKLAMDYVHADLAAEWQTNAQAAWEYGYGNYDGGAKRTKNFTRMGTFGGNAWRPGVKTPEPALKNLVVTPDGGTPVAGHAVVRRWTSPREGYVSIEGTLAHNGGKGDGIRGRIISSRAGELGEWIAVTNKVETKLARVFVGRGDAIDFITDCRDNPDNDAFKWAPVIKMESHSSAATAISEWDAQKNFSGNMAAHPMSPWEKLAQVLLETNEMIFVN